MCCRLVRSLACRIACVSVLLAFVGSARPIWADSCIDYGDYLHWAGSVDTPGTPNSVAAVGPYLYVADGDLLVFDATDPSVPTLLASTGLTAAWDVEISGSYAYVTGGFNAVSALRIVDISNPSSPTLVASVPSGFALDFCVDGSHLYLTDTGSKLNVIDIADPTAPVIVASLYTNKYMSGVAASGNYAYVADDNFKI